MTAGFSVSRLLLGKLTSVRCHQNDNFKQAESQFANDDQFGVLPRLDHPPSNRGFLLPNAGQNTLDLPGMPRLMSPAHDHPFDRRYFAEIGMWKFWT